MSMEDTDIRLTVVKEMNRIQALGEAYVAPLALDETFKDPETSKDSDELRSQRADTYDALPRELSLTETRTLAAFVGSQALERHSALDVPTARRVQIRALGWLASISDSRGDDTTRNSALFVLRNDMGIKGKLRAAELWWQNRDHLFAI